MRKMDRNLLLGRRFSIVCVALIAFAFGLSFAFFFSPGFMSFDSLQQYRQVHKIIPMTTAHPPIMAYTWGVLEEIFKSVSALFWFHQLIYWSGLIIFACVIFSSFWTRVLIIIFLGFWPPLIISTLHVWKDVGMLACLLLSFSALLAYSKFEGKFWIIIAIASMFYATAVRINGFIPVFILSLCLCYLIAQKKGFSSYKLYFSSFFGALALLVIFFIGISLINKNIQKSYGLGTLLVWDIAAVSIDRDVNLFPSYLGGASEPELMEKVKKNNSNEANYHVFSVISPYPEPAYHSRLIRDWVTIVFENPVEYLKHRFHVFLSLSGVHVKGAVYYPFHPGIDENEFGLNFKNMTDVEMWKTLGFFSKIASYPIYQAFYYYLLGIFVIFIGVLRIIRGSEYREQYIVATGLSVSGLLNAISLFFIATAADFRYITWSIEAAVLSACLIAVLGIAEFRRKLKNENF